MKKKERIMIEIDNRKLRQEMRDLAASKHRTLKYIIKDAMVKYLQRYANKD